MGHFWGIWPSPNSLLPLPLGAPLGLIRPFTLYENAWEGAEDGDEGGDEGDEGEEGEEGEEEEDPGTAVPRHIHAAASCTHA